MSRICFSVYFTVSEITHFTAFLWSFGLFICDVAAAVVPNDWLLGAANTSATAAALHACDAYAARQLRLRCVCTRCCGVVTASLIFLHQVCL